MYSILQHPPCLIISLYMDFLLLSPLCNLFQLLFSQVGQKVVLQSFTFLPLFSACLHILIPPHQKVHQEKYALDCPLLYANVNSSSPNNPLFTPPIFPFLHCNFSINALVRAHWKYSLQLKLDKTAG